MATSVRSDTIDAAGPPADLTTPMLNIPPAGASLIANLTASWERTLHHTFEVFRSTIAGAMPRAALPSIKNDATRPGAVLKTVEADAIDLEPAQGRSPVHASTGWPSSSLDVVLGAQLEALDTLRGWLSGLRDTLSDVREWQERQSARLEHLDRQMGLAADLQRELLPQHVPHVTGARLEVAHLPREHVSGDLYDIFRIDDRHVAWGIADAVGHGLPAGMMSALLKRGLRRLAPCSATGRAQGASTTSPTAGSSARHAHVDPADVLRALNQDLIALDCRESRYIAAVVAVYDETTRDLCWARCGMPYPIHLSEGLGTRQVGSEGMLLGVCDDPAIEVIHMRLSPGDVVLFHSDGLEALVGSENPSATLELPGKRRPPRPLHLSPWFASLGKNGLDAALADLVAATRSDSHHAAPPDDVTVLALAVGS